MENKEEGAFACSDNGTEYRTTWQGQLGLTKREYFAVHIATGLSVKAIAGRHNGIEEMEIDVPLYAVRLADALLKALEIKSE